MDKLKASGNSWSAFPPHAWENCLAVLSQQVPKLAQWPKLCFFKFSTRIQTAKYEICGVSIPVEDRRCLVCKQNQNEDEQHFFMFCNGYNVLRQEFINFILSEDVAFVNLTAHDRIKYWLTADNNTCKTTAKFINLMFKKRKELLKM